MPDFHLSFLCLICKSRSELRMVYALAICLRGDRIFNGIEGIDAESIETSQLHFNFLAQLLYVSYYCYVGLGRPMNGFEVSLDLLEMSLYSAAIYIPSFTICSQNNRTLEGRFGKFNQNSSETSVKLKGSL